jgi:hypothetical protein
LAKGSVWTHDNVVSPREGSSGTGSKAWALLPNADYEDGTVAWVHLPIFNLHGQTGLELKFD